MLVPWEGTTATLVPVGGNFQSPPYTDPQRWGHGEPWSPWEQPTTTAGPRVCVRAEGGGAGHGHPWSPWEGIRGHVYGLVSKGADSQPCLVAWDLTEPTHSPFWFL